MISAQFEPYGLHFFLDFWTIYKQYQMSKYIWPLVCVKGACSGHVYVRQLICLDAFLCVVEKTGSEES